MKHFKHVLATTDLSPESFSAVKYAAHLAEGQGAKLTILHVVHSVSLAYTDFVPPVDMVNLEEAIQTAARERLEQWVERHIKRNAKVSLVLERGIVDEAICRYAEASGVSVIVLATHGRRGFGRMVLGSVAERVARNAPCPVLIIKPPMPPAAPKPQRKKAAKAKSKRGRK